MEVSGVRVSKNDRHDRNQSIRSIRQYVQAAIHKSFRHIYGFLCPGLDVSDEHESAVSQTLFRKGKCALNFHPFTQGSQFSLSRKLIQYQRSHPHGAQRPIYACLCRQGDALELYLVTPLIMSSTCPSVDHHV